MATKRDYYEVLGISKNASEEEIKKAFRKLSMKFHPDMQHGKSDAEKKDAENKFKEIAEAYEILSDKSKRSQYDQFGFSGPNGFGGQDVDLGEFFRKHSGIFENLFSGNPFGGFASGFGHFGFDFGNQGNNMGSKEYQDVPEPGRDVQVTMKLSLKENIFGTNREFDLPINETCSECNGSGHSKDSKPETCPNCNGTGMVVSIEKRGFMVVETSHPCGKCHGSGFVNLKHCEKCHGKGRIKIKRHFSEKIEPGKFIGDFIRISGKGEGGRNGGKNGDFLIVFNIEEENEFFSMIRKNGKATKDLKTKAFISPLISLFGGKTEITTPYGIQEINIPMGTTSGTTMKINGCGLRTSNGNGDLYVVLEFDNLCDLSSEDVRKLKDVQSHVGPSNLKRQKDLIGKYNTQWR